MHEDTTKAETKSKSVDKDLSFSVTMEQFNSVFGISADTLRALADSYNTTPERLIIRALTLWAKADIPDLDLDSPSLTPAQIDYLAQRRNDLAAQNDTPPQSLQEMFKKLFEGTGDKHEDAESSPRNGGHS